MCGIAGFINNHEERNSLPVRIRAMLNPIRHRGPDDGGVWVAEQSGVAMGHRRLSILDLSPAGHQPMELGRFVIVFNGEIYNHLDLRKDLESSGHLPTSCWRGHSDTETILACFTIWGIKKTLQSAVGMFALALWDKYQSTLTLARDRIGEKPLYYGWQKDTFLFGSELKSLRVHPSFSSAIDWNAASSYLRCNYIPAPSSIYQGIHKLTPGTFLELTPNHVQRKTLPSPVAYWSLSDVAKRGAEYPYTGSFVDAVDELDSLVRQAVQLQSIADVPVGALLSGGIDSSTVVAMMQSATNSKVTTFSIGMTDATMDESQHAANVARHLGTNHVEHIIQPHEALNVIPRLTEIWDEPFADSSQIPTYLVSKLAKQQVTVALSGDGGDEFFLGYQRYKLQDKLWRTRYLGMLPWETAGKAVASVSGREMIGTMLRRGTFVLDAWRQPNGQALARYWFDLYRKGDVPIDEQVGIEMLNCPIMADVISSSGLWDATTYLPDDILVKVDRAAMANSLEIRAPLLDHRIIEFALQLPLRYKYGSGVGKKVLRDVLYRHVPRHLVDRPKMGFSIPLAKWLREDLRAWAEHLLVQIQGDSHPFNKPMIDQMWNEHLSAKRDHTERLWGVLILISHIYK